MAASPTDVDGDTDVSERPLDQRRIEPTAAFVRDGRREMAVRDRNADASPEVTRPFEHVRAAVYTDALGVERTPGGAVWVGVDP